MRFLTTLETNDVDYAVATMLEQRDRIAVDIETVSLDNKLPIGLGVAVTEQIGFYFFDMVDEYVQKLFEQTPLVIVFNGSFDVPILEKLGHKIRHWEDAMLAAYACGLPEKSLEELSKNFLNRPFTKVTSQWKKKSQGNINVDHRLMGKWCVQHAMNTLELWNRLPKVPLYWEIDRPCADLVIEMEGYGLLVDQYKLTQVEQEAYEQAKKLELSIKAELEKPDINLASNPQVAAALQDKGIIGTRKTKSGAESVSDESLRPLHNPLTDMILKHRSIQKTLTTYVPAFRNIDHVGCIHTSFGYTNTGRWRSSGPNLQNLTQDSKFDYGGE